MNIEMEDILISDNSLELYDNDWIKDSSEIYEDDKYSVYHGTGDSSLVKIFIKEEIILDLQNII